MTKTVQAQKWCAASKAAEQKPGVLFFYLLCGQWHRCIFCSNRLASAGCPSFGTCLLDFNVTKKKSKTVEPPGNPPNKWEMEVPRLELLVQHHHSILFPVSLCIRAILRPAARPSVSSRSRSWTANTSGLLFCGCISYIKKASVIFWYLSETLPAPQDIPKYPTRWSFTSVLPNKPPQVVGP